MRGIQVFAKMAEEDNKGLKMMPLWNIKSFSTGKNGWGMVEIAVDNETITNLMKNKLYGGFIFADKEEFDRIKNENTVLEEHYICIVKGRPRECEDTCCCECQGKEECEWKCLLTPHECGHAVRKRCHD